MKNIPLPSMGALTKREFAMLCVAIALHVVAIGWAFSRIAEFAYNEKIPTSSIAVELYSNSPAVLPEIDQIAPAPAVENIFPDNTPAPKEPAPASKPHARPDPDISTKLSSASQSVAPSAPNSLASTDRVRISIPPSAKLRYHAQSVRAGQHIPGSGSIFWQTTGSSFSIQGELDIPLNTSLGFSSEGLIDPEFGIAPLIYTEKRQQEQPSNIHFQRDRNTVIISSSSQTRGLRAGEQDSASVIWQLVRMGRHNSELFIPDARFELPVASGRGAEIWQIQVVGQEEIDAPIGRLKTWHMIYTPNPGSGEPVLDIWLAPDKEWYPVKLRYSDANSDYVEMLISEIFITPNR